MPTENINEVADNAAETPSMTAFNEAAAEVNTPDARFTAEDIAKARKQEKDKVYSQLDTMKEELAALRKEREERAVVEAERLAKRQAREAERAAEKKAKAEEEMSVKQLLQTKEKEWQAQIESERAEREKAFALLEREREFQELQQYRMARVDAERENIAPELIDLVSGNNKEEIERSIADLKARSEKIFENIAAVSQNSRKDMQGARITVPASGPLDNDSSQAAFTPEAIANMSAAEYAKHRSKLLGNSNTRGQGLFGN